jgi:hypothetical protein
MLVEYIKDILNSELWDVEFTDGKYIVKQLIDCKNNDFKYQFSMIHADTLRRNIKIQLKTYLPEEVLYEVICELINVPKPEIRLYTSINKDNANYDYTYINLRSSYGMYANNYLIDNSDINTDVTDVRII